MSRLPIFLLMSLAMSAQIAQAADDEMQITPAAAVYKLRVKRAGHIADGSAVLVAPGRLLTACHVTRGAESIKVGREEVTWRAYPARIDIDHDLCVLTVAELSAARPAVIGPTEGLRIGEPVRAIGYPRGGRLDVSYGEIKGLHPYDDATVLQVSAAFDHGQSGGGLFDAAGRLIGIIGFKAVAGGDFNYALPLAWAGDAIPGQGATPLVPAPEQRAFWQRTDEARRPLFLRAASLEANRDWEGLRNVARQWVATDTYNPAPWLCLGRAWRKLGHEHTAALAFAQAEWLMAPLAAKPIPAVVLNNQADATPTAVASAQPARQ
ncbi:MAG TPA: serine protease [Burkholderiales bacterium]